MTDTTQITVSRSIDASTSDVFDVLSAPHRHTELDGSGFVRGLEKGDRISASGQVFTMAMEGDHMGGEYSTDNHVSGFDQNHLIAWKTAPAGEEPPGWEWLWELEATSPSTTDVTLTYDWSHVPAEVLKEIPFPLVEESELEASLGKLAEAVAG